MTSKARWTAIVMGVLYDAAVRPQQGGHAVPRFGARRRVANVLGAVVLAAGASVQPAPAQADPPPVVFEDVSDRLDFCRGSVASGGDGLGGAAWLDYNNDGFLDLFLANGKENPNALFRNNGDGTFTNVAAEAGVENGLGNTGVLAADFDNDGFKDLFLAGDGGVTGTGQSPVQLYHNNQDGTFTDITPQSGITSPPSAMDLTAGDIDNDGFLDLFIAAPGLFGTQHRSKLYRNNGDLTFTDISTSAGVDVRVGACAAVFTDYDRDGWIDLMIVTCLGSRNSNVLFRNNGDLTFTDVAAQAGIRVPGAWMGIGLADYDNDDDIDLFVTNFGETNDPNILFESNGDGTYVSGDVAAAAGVGTLEFGWGCTFTDFDNDGYADIFFAGSLPSVLNQGRGNPGRMLFNNRDGTFTDASAPSCSGGRSRRASSSGEASTECIRAVPVDLSNQWTSGVAQGDFDNDGFADIVVVVEPVAGGSCRPVLLRNLGNENHWVTIRLVGTTSNRDAVGAQVRVVAGPLRQIKEVYAGTSFLSTESPWLTFGLADQESTDSVKVTWPSGLVEQFANISTGQTVTLVEGQGDGDCNGNGITDKQDIASGVSADCNGNGIADDCEADCNANGIADSCEIADGRSTDANTDGVPDECQPQLVRIMEGVAVEFAAGSSDTFISPMSEDSPLGQFTLETTEDLVSISATSVYTGPIADGGGTRRRGGGGSDGDSRPQPLASVPTVVGFTNEGGGRHTVELDPAPAPGEWLKLSLTVRGTSPHAVTFSVFLAHHPGDINQDGVVDVHDATAFGEQFRNGGSPLLIDLNGDGAVDVRDATTFGDLWHGGGGALQPWNGSSLPNKPQ